MRGAEITSLSSTMASGRPTFCVVASPNLDAPRRLKRKLTIGSFGAAVEPWLRVRQVLAREYDPPLDRDPLPAGILRGHQLGIGRSGIPEEPELELRRPAEDLLEPRRVLQARHLDEDAVAPCRWIEGSVVPSWSTRRRTTSMD
jgi:hypothetical protein